MAHEVEQNKNGDYKAFFVEKPAWHNLGTVLSDAPTIEEAWHLAYPHTLFKMDLEATMITDDGEKVSMPLQNSKVIVRDDGTEFDTVGSDFELVQPIEILEHFRPLLDTGYVKLEAGGSLRGGSQMWALAKINGADCDVIPGDQIKSYFLMFTGFDGSLRIGMSQTNTRVVCANTLAMAQNAGIDYQFKHTKHVRERMGKATDTIKKAIENFHKDAESYAYLASKKMTRSTQIEYIANVFLTVEELSGKTEVSGKKQAIVETVSDLLDTQKGLEYIPAIRGTAWQAYNAVTDYVTHSYGRTEDSRLNAQWFGASAGINRKALDLALTM